MAEPFLSEIRLMAFAFAPRGWAKCDGQILPINQNQALFALIGTTYGGDGRTTFALPDLRGRAPLHRAAAYPLGTTGGDAKHTLTMAEVPGAHGHAAMAVGAQAGSPRPAQGALAENPDVYHAPVEGETLSSLSPHSIGAAGGESHENMQPFLAVPFCIALQGIFPSRP